MKVSELEYVVKRIASNVDLPLSVDLESGYGENPEQIADNIKKLVQLGVVGINIEDSKVEGDRVLLDAEDFSEKLKQTKKYLKKDNVDVFLNVRTDTFILLKENMIKETIHRVRLYQEAGADGIFTPCIEKVSDIQEVVNCTALPINVMCMSNLPNFDSLAQIGVKRISMGNFLFDKMYEQYEGSLQNVLLQKSFNSIF